MANYLDASPDASCINAWRQSGQLVPFAHDEKLLFLIDPTHLVEHVWTDRSLDVEDYVVGLELLGYRFQLERRAGGGDVLFRKEPDPPLAPAWDAHALRIMTAFGPGRTPEVKAFIRERDGVR